MKRKRGRPKISGRGARAKYISARLLPTEEALIRSAIQKSGKTKSNWVRDALLAAAAAEK
ncbi:MAG: hypothetical protein U1G07_08930 [Verrucomicrobiota bacterium]